MPELTQLGRYKIDAHLGSGAYADVYRAVDTALNRIVALKVLKPALLVDEEAFQRFVQEAQVASTLFHPHIATVLDIGQADGYHYLAMRFVDGESLDKVIQGGGSMTWHEALHDIEQIASALDYAHSKGLVHRDVKPQNIIISAKEGAVLTDFGLTKAIQSQKLTASGIVVGTPHYIAPEIWHGEQAVPASDEYALACVLVEMLTNKVLFDASTPPAVMHLHLHPAPLPEEWPSGTPSGLSQVLKRALAQEPDQRFVLREFIQQLKNLSATSAQQKSAPQQPVQPPPVKTEAAKAVSPLRLARITPEYIGWLRPLTILTGHTGMINSIIFSPNGQLIATGSQDGTVKLWLTQQRRLWTTLELRTGAVLSLAFNAEGTKLAAGLSDHTIKICNIQANNITVENLSGIQGPVSSISYSLGGQLAAASPGNGGMIWGKWGTKYYAHNLSWVAFSPAKSGFLAISYNNDKTGVIQVHDRVIRVNIQPLFSLGDNSGNRYLTFSPRGDLLGYVTHWDGIKLVSIKNQRLIGSISSQQNFSTSLAFTQTGIIASGGHNRSVKLWRISDTQCLRELEGDLNSILTRQSNDHKNRMGTTHTNQIDSVYGLAFSPDGTLLATGIDDGSLILWGIPTE